jgi:dTMP kinase
MPLIVIEGIDGCGKSTQAGLLAERLAAAGRETLRLREPGGTALGEALRRILLDPATKAGAEAELFLYLSARAQLCREVIAPALARGAWVVLDRFWHSTVAYQGYGLGLDPQRIRAAVELAVAGVKPDVALWLRLDPAEAARRRTANRGPADRIEARGEEYLARVEAGYAALAAAGDLEELSANGEQTLVAERVWRRVGPLVRSSESLGRPDDRTTGRPDG